MKRIIAFVLVLALGGAVCCGCGRPESAGTSGPEERDVLRVATSPDFAPMVFVDPSKSGQDRFVGFDIMLAKFIAGELNMELEIIPMDFDSCQTAVYDGIVDMSISGYAWSAEREEKFNLSHNYRAGNSSDSQVLITLSGNGGRYSSAEGLAGALVGAQNTSLQQLLVSEQLPDAELTLFSDLDEGLQMLEAGTLDCIAVAEGNAEAIIANHPGVVLSGYVFDLDERHTGNVILLQKGNDALTERVNEILEKASLFYDQWYAEAKATAGIQVTYDTEGNVVRGDETK